MAEVVDKYIDSEFGTFEVENAEPAHLVDVFFTVFHLSDCGRELIGVVSLTKGGWCFSYDYRRTAFEFEASFGYKTLDLALKALIYRHHCELDAHFEELVNA